MRRFYPDLTDKESLFRRCGDAAVSTGLDGAYYRTKVWLEYP